MHPMFVKLFMETDVDDLLFGRTGGAAPAGPGEPSRRWPSGPPPVTGSATGNPAAVSALTIPRSPAMTESIAPVAGSVISGPDAQAAIWFLGALAQVRVSGEHTGGAFALADHLAQRGNASPVHVHDRDDETFFVLDGERPSRSGVRLPGQQRGEGAQRGRHLVPELAAKPATFIWTTHSGWRPGQPSPAWSSPG
ncbi:MAG TPA: hypothetical protein VFQ68_32425 [Streptosporangiaceae bacterium]|nr:hypothetical protein [Streptosporangiaceae bacterium]